MPDDAGLADSSIERHTAVVSKPARKSSGKSVTGSKHKRSEGPEQPGAASASRHGSMTEVIEILDDDDDFTPDVKAVRL